MKIEEVFNAAITEHQAGNAKVAEQLYREILFEDPDHGPTLHHLGLLLRNSGKPREAVACLQRAAICDPDSAICQNNLANVLNELGHREEAIQAYEAALGLNPDYVSAQYNLATLLLEGSDPEGAARWYRKVLESDPDDADALGGLGIALKEVGALDEATTCMERSIALRPGDPRAHYLMGLLLKDRKEFKHAISAFSDALRLDPGLLLARLNLADVLCECKEFEAAETECRAALELAPGHIEAHCSLVNVLIKQERWSDAERVIGQAVDLAPDNVDVIFAHANVLLNRSKLDEAISSYQRVPETDPRYPIAQNNLGNCLQKQARFTPAITAFRKALLANPSFSEAHSNILLCSNYLPDMDSSKLFNDHQLWAKQHADHLGRGVSFDEIDPSPQRRLRLGYISPNFCFHSVAYFIDAVLEHHDRRAFEVTCYANAHKSDEYTKRLKGFSDRWRDVHGMDDDRVAAIIRDDAIDVLVELAGHTAGNRLLVMARRPAPVLVSYLGYPNTTGLPQIGYRVTDEWADPPGISDKIHTETLLRLASGFLCFRPSPIPAEVTDPPVLREGKVTFGSFNNTAKVNARVVEAWSRILLALPDSRIIIKSRHVADAGARRVLVENFSEHGVAMERIEIIRGLLPKEQHLELYGSVDIALDPFPYNGATTTCEALWMGVPVITLCGESHRARVGMSLMQQVGVQELVAFSESEYVNLAVTLAQDVERLRKLRKEMRGRMTNSFLMDAARTVRDLEDSYRVAWRNYCRSAKNSFVE